MKWRRRGSQNPGTDLVTKIKIGRHRDRVTDPDQRNGNRKIRAKQDCQRCCWNHLKWHGNRRHKQANGKGSRHGFAIQMPKIGIVQQGAEHLQMLVLADSLRFRHVAL